MDNRRLAWLVAVLVVAVVVVVVILGSMGDSGPLVPGQPSGSSPSVTVLPSVSPTLLPSPTLSPSPSVSPVATEVLGFSVVGVYPHSVDAYTQGLVFSGGVLFESTGGIGSSSLRRVDLDSGEVLQMVSLSGDFYGEGIVIVDDRIVWLTWLSNVGFVYDRESFDLLGNFTYPTAGWGIAYDGSRLIMSDGSSSLYFLDPVTFEKVWQVSVRDGDVAVTHINELEFVKGDIYANIWLEQKIAIINPQTGQVKAWIDLTGIHGSSGANSVLNGIAYDSASDRLFVTGKNWPNLYEIKIVPKG